MIYQQIQQDRTKRNADRTRLAVIMSEITIDGKPMEDSSAIKKLSQMRKSIVNNIEIYKKANKIEQLESEGKYLICIDISLKRLPITNFYNGRAGIGWLAPAKLA